MTMEEILKDNNVQRFDLRSERREMHNLAVKPEKNGEAVLRMNKLLTDLIGKEVGVNDGRFPTPIIGAKQ